ncbi:MAG: WD40 repeat domain-containing protein, partial [Candidatus Electrothrix sp. MAN1_4]|nr:WD40 repeat domain-containing protein [Candidatus Electrothrix sp. MAN1_4]
MISKVIKSFAAYVQRMFLQPRNGEEYEEEKTRCRLTFLAYNMQKHGQTVFQIENLQPSWLLTKGEYWLYIMLSRLLEGLLGGIGSVLLFLLFKALLEDLLYTELNQTIITCLVIFLLLFFGAVMAGGAGLAHGLFLPCRRTANLMFLYNFLMFLISLTPMLFLAVLLHVFQPRDGNELISIVTLKSMLFLLPYAIFFYVFQQRLEKKNVHRDVLLLENMHLVRKRFGFILLCGIFSGVIHFIWLNHPYLALYNKHTDQQIILREQNTSVKDTEFSPDGELVVTTGANGTILWTGTGEKIKTISSDIQRDVEFSPDGTFFITEDYHYRHTALWTREGEHVKKVGNSVREVKFTPNASFFVTIDNNKAATLWSKEQEKLKELGDNIRSVEFSSDGAFLITGQDYFYGPKTLWQRKGKNFEKLYADLKNVTFSPDGTVFVTIDNNGVATLRIREGEKIRELGNNIGRIKFSPDGTQFITNDQDGTVILWTRQGDRIKKLGDNIEFVSFSPDGTLLFTHPYSSRQTTLWIHKKGETKKITSNFRHTIFSPDGRAFAVDTGKNTWSLWNRNDDNVLKVKDNIKDMRLVPNSRGEMLFVIEDENGTQKLWTRKGERIKAISPDDTLFVSTDKNNTATLWTRKGKKIKEIDNNIQEVRFSPDSTLLVTEDNNGTMGLWTQENGNILQFKRVDQVTFSPNGEGVLFTSKYNFGSLAVLWLLAAFTVGLLSSLRINTAEPSRNKPNEGIWRTLNNSLLLGAATGLFWGSILAVAEQRFALLGIGVLNAFGLGILCGLPIAVWFGLTDFLQHFTLRFVLWKYDYAPWNYARFLDYATDRIFLRKIGGGYTFDHHLLLENFAADAESQLNFSADTIPRWQDPCRQVLPEHTFIG